MGITTAQTILQLDAILFEPDIETMLITHKIEDSRDIFEKKVLFAYDWLPSFIRKSRPTLKRSAGEIRVRHGKNSYSSMRVSTSGRSGTLRYLHVSEYAKLCLKRPADAEEIISGALNAGNSQITTFESTAEEAHGKFYEICQKAETLSINNLELTSMDYKFFFFGWQLHPDYYLDAKFKISSEWRNYFARVGVDDERRMRWYIKKQEVEQGERMKQEYPSNAKEAFEKVLEGTYYSTQIIRKGLIGDYPWVPGKKVHTGWDIGVSDATTIIFFQNVDGMMRIIGHYANNGVGFPHYEKVLRDLQRERGFEFGTHYAPHDIGVKEWGSGVTRIEKIWEDYKFRFTAVQKMGIIESIDMVRMFFSDVVIDKSSNEKLIDALRAYRKGYNDRLGIWDSKPFHNWASDYADGFRYAILGRNSNRNEMLDNVRESVIEGGVL